ncbi:TPA: hypothetical protein N0F65_007330 [Lagenidium giganteum]|uniref:Phosphodiesterase n=1 Tax=Lagenidium giganteum TaxID=4803 RepID=A0AAV2Z3A6_9STRA|nr:TPA: hypothetical protein N0F65_007330 [Lagenidium giganteum]
MTAETAGGGSTRMIGNRSTSSRMERMGAAGMLSSARGSTIMSPTRRSSIGVPLSALIFPRSAADRHESNKLTRLMEEKYGFHYFTNTFCLNPLVEMDYQAFFTETNINPATYASLGAWIIWVLLSMLDAYSLFIGTPNESEVAKFKLLLSLIIFVPVPLLVICCRSPRFHGYEQFFLCSIVHCFAIAIIGAGMLPVYSPYRQMLLSDFYPVINNITNQNTSSPDILSEKYPFNISMSFDNNTVWWKYEDFNGTTGNLLQTYLEEKVIPISHLNMNLLRPLIVLVVAPMFKLDTFHYIFTAFTVNLGFWMLVSFMYPQSSWLPCILNKFLLIICLVGVTLVLVFRVRQTDRFLRLNFLHAKTVEERARASHMQKEIIINENKSLKRMLEERTRSAAEPLDFDSPMAKVILDLKNLQRTASLTPELRENLDGIVLLLSKKGQNLFAPDIHEQLKQKREGDLDGDTKSWAATVLANKSYTRNNRRASAAYAPGTQLTEGGASHGGTNGGGDRYNEARLHPEVHAPSDELLNSIGEMMERDGWNVDTHLVAEMTNNRPISYITYIVFEQHNLFQLGPVKKNTLANFLWFLDIGYHRNPYHNNCHAADVVSSVEYIISVLDNGYIQDLLNYQEIFAAIVAAAVHDFRHPGKTNNFMVKSGSDLAIEYSDSSVLERMHLAEAFFLAKDPLFNIFGEMAPAQVSDVRKAIIEMVLSTDLSVHLQLVGSLKTALISQETSDVIHSPMMVMKIVIKCADIGHSSKNVRLHARWSDLIIEEFFLQGDDEAMLGMDISPFMNRNSENSAKNQVGFFEFIILPFFEVVAEVVFRPEFKTILDQAHQNYKLWKKAEAQNVNSIKDILDQLFDIDSNTTSTPVTH